jgi:hypothetical protein
MSRIVAGRAVDQQKTPSVLKALGVCPACDGCGGGVGRGGSGGSVGRGSDDRDDGETQLKARPCFTQPRTRSDSAALGGVPHPLFHSLFHSYSG